MTYIPALKHHPLFHCLLALPVIFLVALANDNANAQNFAAEWAAECNARVGSPYEPENLGTGRGLELADVDGYAAYYYCKEAYTAAPETPSNIYRMARVFHTRNQSGPALNYYNTAANLGYLPAQHDVGMLLLEGHGEVLKNPALAAKWLRRAAEQGFAPSQYALATLSFSGSEVDATEAAVRLWREAAKQHYSRAEEALGFAYQKGIGVPRNVAQAQRWFRRAAKSGSEAAQRELGSPAMVQLRNQERGAAILVGLLALMLATAGDSPSTGSVSPGTEGGGFMDMTDPMHFWGATMMMDIR